MKYKPLIELISSLSRNGVFCMSRYPVTTEEDLAETLQILSTLEKDGRIVVKDRLQGGLISMFEMVKP